MADPVTVLYPFIEEAFSPETADAVNEIRKISAAGDVKPVVIVNRHGRTTELLRKAHLAYYELKAIHLIYPGDFYPVALYRLIFSSLPLFLFIKGQKIDVIHFYGIMPALLWTGAARMFRIPYVISLYNIERYAKYASLTLADASRLTCPSEMVMERLPNKYRFRAEVVPPAVSVPFIPEKQLEKRRRQWLTERGLPEKALLMAAETDQSVDNLFILGEKLASDLKTPIVFVTGTEGEQVTVGRVTVFPAAPDGFDEALPQSRFFLGLDGRRATSSGTMKAMLAGVPAAAVDEGVYPEIIKNGKTGILFPFSDPGKWASRLAEALSSPEKTAETAATAKTEMDKTVRDIIARRQESYRSPHPKKSSTAGVGLLNDEGE